MTDETGPEADRFTQVVVQLALMNADTARAIASEAAVKSVHPWDLAVKKRALSAAEADIVETLLHPLETAPGYEILELIGKGGMGIVYRARQISLNRAVALKTILATNRYDETSIRRFEQEALTVAKLHHPNIVEALDFGKHAERWYFAMEYIAGRSAQHEITENGHFSEAVTWAIVRQSAAGLAHALRNGVTHHDIKPANILLLPPPDGYALPTGVPLVKITDFGLAFLNHGLEQQDTETQENFPAGSPPYMAPELFRGRKPDWLSDIYSLGVSALQLMTGERIFSGGSYEQILDSKLHPERVVNDHDFPGLSTRTRDMLRAMIASNRQDRPQTYEEIIRIALELSRESDFSSVTAQRTFSARDSTKDLTTVIFDNDPSSGDHDRETASFNPRSPVSKSKTAGLDRSRRIFMTAAAAVTVLLLLGFFIWNSMPARLQVRKLDVAETRPLFDGTTLSGFAIDQTMLGAWQAAIAPDASPAFACRSFQGAINCQIPDWETYRITLFVLSSEQTEFVDIAFDQAENARQTVVRLQGDQVLVGSKQEDFGNLQSTLLPPLSSDLKKRFHVVHIERQSDQWYIFFEETFVGTVPDRRTRAQKSSPSDAAPRFIRIAVQHQSEPTDDVESANTQIAYFTEFFVERLQASPSER
jgi:serine/threonine-protein kinase